MKFYPSRTITGRFKELRIFMVGEQGYIFAPTVVKQVGTNTWDGVAYGNGKYVAIGSGINIPGYLTTSTDAQRWTIPERFGAIINSPSIAYGNGKFVVTNGRQALTTIDGNTWTENQITSVPEDQMFKVYHINGLFFALDINSYLGEMYLSSNGEFWEKVFSSNNLRMRSITYGNGKYYMTAQSGASTTSFYSSPDGITWNYLRKISGNGIFYIAYGNDKLVAASSTGYITSSSDGVTWTTPQNKGIGTDLRIQYADGKFMVVTIDNRLSRFSTSLDGENWTVPERVKNELGNPLESKVCNICAIP